MPARRGAESVFGKLARGAGVFSDESQETITNSTSSKTRSLADVSTESDFEPATRHHRVRKPRGKVKVNYQEPPELNVKEIDRRHRRDAARKPLKQLHNDEPIFRITPDAEKPTKPAPKTRPPKKANVTVSKRQKQTKVDAKENVPKDRRARSSYNFSDFEDYSLLVSEGSGRAGIGSVDSPNPEFTDSKLNDDVFVANSPDLGANSVEVQSLPGFESTPARKDLATVDTSTPHRVIQSLEVQLEVLSLSIIEGSPGDAEPVGNVAINTRNLRNSRRAQNNATKTINSTVHSNASLFHTTLDSIAESDNENSDDLFESPKISPRRTRNRTRSFEHHISMAPNVASVLEDDENESFNQSLDTDAQCLDTVSQCLEAGSQFSDTRSQCSDTNVSRTSSGKGGGPSIKLFASDSSRTSQSQSDGDDNNGNYHSTHVPENEVESSVDESTAPNQEVENHSRRMANGLLSPSAASHSTPMKDRGPSYIHGGACRKSVLPELDHFASSLKLLTPVKLPGTSRVVSPRTKLLHQCDQPDFLPFSQLFTKTQLSSCKKIGEGVYGEVFSLLSPQKQPLAVKVIPIEGGQLVNDEPQKTFEEILPEIVISKELSQLRENNVNRTDNFVELHRSTCVRGRYPDKLMSEWNKFNDRKGSENDSPEMFLDDQLYLVLEFTNGGEDLENYKFAGVEQALSLLHQVTLALAVAERQLMFEHRDLHLGNILIAKTRQKQLTYLLDGESLSIPSHGVKICIIDFTLSRLTRDECTVYLDLSKDETLFQGQGDPQFDVYRRMRDNNGDIWDTFEPVTNVFWLSFLAEKLAKFAFTRKSTKLLRQLRHFHRSLADYESAADVVANELAESEAL